MTRPCLAASAALLLAACVSSPPYSCPVPPADGGCHSVAEVYRESAGQAIAASAAATRASSGGAPHPPSRNEPANAAIQADGAGPGVPRNDDVHLQFAVAQATGAMPAPLPGAAQLSAPHVLRILVMPWQDADGDLQAGGYVYLRLDQGQWTIAP